MVQLVLQNVITKKKHWYSRFGGAYPTMDLLLLNLIIWQSRNPLYIYVTTQEATKKCLDMLFINGGNIKHTDRIQQWDLWFNSCLTFQHILLLLKDSIVKLAVKAGMEFIFLMKISTCKMWLDLQHHIEASKTFSLKWKKYCKNTKITGISLILRWNWDPQTPYLNQLNMLHGCLLVKCNRLA